MYFFVWFLCCVAGKLNTICFSLSTFPVAIPARGGGEVEGQEKMQGRQSAQMFQNRSSSLQHPQVITAPLFPGHTTKRLSTRSSNHSPTTSCFTKWQQWVCPSFPSAGSLSAHIRPSLQSVFPPYQRKSKLSTPAEDKQEPVPTRGRGGQIQ